MAWHKQQSSTSTCSMDRHASGSKLHGLFMLIYAKSQGWQASVQLSYRSSARVLQPCEASLNANGF